MGQHNKKNDRSELPLSEHIQLDATDLVRASRFIVESRFAYWMNMKMQDGAEGIVLMFPKDSWKMDADNKLTFTREIK